MDTHEHARGIFRFVVLIPHKDTLKALDEYRRKLFAAGFAGACSFPQAAPLAAVSRPFTEGELKELARKLREMSRKEAGKILIGDITAAAFGEEFTFFGPCLDFSGGETVFSARAEAVPGAGESPSPAAAPAEKILFPAAEAAPAGFLSGGMTAPPAGAASGFIGGKVPLPAGEDIFPASARRKILQTFFPPVLCAALLGPGEAPPFRAEAELPAGGGFRAAALANLAVRPLDSGTADSDGIGHRGTQSESIGGKAAAGTAEKPAPPFFSLEWKRGPLVWLPAYKKDKKKHGAK